MKISPILSFVLLHLAVATASTLTSFSQNYQPVKSNFQNFYKSDSGQFNGIRIDSVAFSNGDSLFFNYTTLGVSDIGNCYDVKSSTWIGKQVIIKPNGDNLFFNKTNDTIVLKSLSIVGEEWTVYTYPDGSILKGKIDTIQVENILGFDDSVKVITLQKADSLGNPLASSINGTEFRIGQINGLVSSLDIYEFPFDTIAYKLCGKQNLQLGIYYRGLEEYNVGDEFHIYYESSNVNTGWCPPSAVSSYRDYYIITLTSKLVYPDSIRYFFHKKNGYYTYYQSSPISPANNTYTYTESDYSELILPSADSVHFPNEFVYYPSNDTMYQHGIGFLYKMSIDTCNGRIRTFRNNPDDEWYHFEDMNNQGCLTQVVNLSPNCFGGEEIYLDGIFKTFHQYIDCGDQCSQGHSESGIRYYKIGNEECGTPIALSIILYMDNLIEAHNIKISPNPASDPS